MVNFPLFLLLLAVVAGPFVLYLGKALKSDVFFPPPSSGFLWGKPSVAAAAAAAAAAHSGGGTHHLRVFLLFLSSGISSSSFSVGEVSVGPKPKPSLKGEEESPTTLKCPLKTGEEREKGNGETRLLTHGQKTYSLFLPLPPPFLHSTPREGKPFFPRGNFFVELGCNLTLPCG